VKRFQTIFFKGEYKRREQVEINKENYVLNLPDGLVVWRASQHCGFGNTLFFVSFLCGESWFIKAIILGRFLVEASGGGVASGVSIEKEKVDFFPRFFFVAEVIRGKGNGFFS
jgi:hypothetical protein